VSGIPAKLVKAVAEGQFGMPLSRLYWFLAGKKTIVGLALGAAYAGLVYLRDSGQCVPCFQLSDYTFYAFTGLVAVGLADGSLREKPPQKPPSIR
jgi:hypothetical protein